MSKLSDGTIKAWASSHIFLPTTEIQRFSTSEPKFMTVPLQVSSYKIKKRLPFEIFCASMECSKGHPTISKLQIQIKGAFTQYLETQFLNLITGQIKHKLLKSIMV